MMLEMIQKVVITQGISNKLSFQNARACALLSKFMVNLNQVFIT